MSNNGAVLSWDRESATIQEVEINIVHQTEQQQTREERAQ